MDDFLNSSKGKLNDWNDGRKKRNSELSANFICKSGKKQITTNLLPNVTIYQQKDGYIYFNKDDSILFELLNYSWDGPQYKTVIKTDTKGHEKGKTKRKGRVAGAVIGSVLLPGAGAVAGALMGTHKKSNKEIASHTETYQEQEEIPCIASLQVKKVSTGEIATVTFDCTSELNAKLRQFRVRAISNNIESVQQTSVINNEANYDPYEELAKLKKLLDIGAITQEEFDLKKKQLLGL